MLIKDLLREYSGVLAQNGFESPYLDVELLFSFVSNLNRMDLISKSEEEIDKKVFKKFEKLFKRRLKHEPIAYILGHKFFCGFDFKVNKNVLIPRPLTESLVDIFMESIRADKDLKNVIEIGTGSGCVIVSIVKKIASFYTDAKFDFFASDISSRALKVAKENSRYFCVNNKIKFLRGNLKFPRNKKFDFIVANLPYVDEQSVDFNNDNQKDLAFEPRLALFHTDSGFYLVRKLLKKIIKNKLLSNNGFVFLEIEKGQSERVRDEFGWFFNIQEFFDGRILKMSLKIK